MKTVFKRLSYVLYLLFIGLVIGMGIYSLKRAAPPLPAVPTPIEQTDEEVTTEEDDDADGEDNSSDQTSPWSLLQSALPAYYHAPSVNTDKPTVVLILTGLGLDQGWTQDLLTNLKTRVTLAFQPDSSRVTDQLQKATSQGFDVLLTLPAEENLAKLKVILYKLPPHINIIADHGSDFTRSAADLEPVLAEIKNQNRLFIDPRSTMYTQAPIVCKTLNIPYCGVDLALSQSADSAQVDEFLKKIVQHGQENGIVIATAPAIPIFVHRFVEWGKASEQKNITFATISDLKAKGYFLMTNEKHQEKPNGNE